MASPAVIDYFTPEQLALHAPKIHAAVDQSSDTSVCYFVQKGADGPIKIGYTANITTRMRSLRVKHGKDCRLLATRAGGRGREGTYHFQFAYHFIGNEWFHPHPEILAEIERVNSGPAHAAKPEVWEMSE